MFTFLIQLLDLVVWKQVGLFFIFFVLSWTIYLIKVFRSSRYRVTWHGRVDPASGVSVIVPVVDEKREVFEEALESVDRACRKYGFAYEIIVVANGVRSDMNAAQAQRMGFNVIRVPTASKRRAIEAGAKVALYPFTVILDSDTIATEQSVYQLIQAFADESVGGATPEHRIFRRDQNIWRRISDWLEDSRFHEVVAGQSVTGAVSCLPGRMFAIRSHLLRDAVPELVSQKFIGHECVSGDDRFLTSWLLQRGWKTVFQRDALVYTDAPNTFRGFVLQRLRWSRTSLRETILSLPWIFRYPYMAFTTLSTVVMRWFFFIVFINAILVWTGISRQDHFLWHYLPYLLNFSFIAAGVFLGFLASGFLKNLRHLLKYPQDIVFLPVYLMVTTLVLTPVEWFGNITLTEKGWMTRRTASR